MAEEVSVRLRDVLGSGDRKEVGRTTEVALEVLDNPAMLPDLLSCLSASDETVISHAAHAVMQIGAEDNQLFQPHVDQLIHTLEHRTQWEIGEQLPKVICELDLTPEQVDRLVPVLVAQIDDKSAIAAACALSGLKRLGDRGLISAKAVEGQLATALQSPRKAVAARARRLVAG